MSEERTISSVYFGRSGCACGCRGNHSEVTINNPQKRLVNLALTKINMVAALPKKQRKRFGYNLIVDVDFTAVEDSGRITSVYYK